METKDKTILDITLSRFTFSTNLGPVRSEELEEAAIEEDFFLLDLVLKELTELSSSSSSLSSSSSSTAPLFFPPNVPSK